MIRLLLNKEKIFDLVQKEFLISFLIIKSAQKLGGGGASNPIDSTF